MGLESGFGFMHQKNFHLAVSTGTERLKKSALATAISAFIAGLYVTFGGLVALAVAAVFTAASGSAELGWFAGSLFYPLGFVFVVLGHSELFTENFLSPVLAVWEGEGTHAEIVRLWSVGFLFNIVGVGVIVWLITISGFITHNDMIGAALTGLLVDNAEHVARQPLDAIIWKAVYAGLFINFMSWLIVNCRRNLTKVLIIALTTFPIMLLETHHCVVGSAEFLLGISHGAEVSYGAWFVGFLLPVALGNHIGGVVFVAAVHYLQHFLHRRDAKIRGS